jgi:hypothetical protein
LTVHPFLIVEKVRDLQFPIDFSMLGSKVQIVFSVRGPRIPSEVEPLGPRSSIADARFVLPVHLSVLLQVPQTPIASSQRVIQVPNAASIQNLRFLLRD